MIKHVPEQRVRFREPCPEGRKDCDLCFHEQCHVCLGEGRIDVDFQGFVGRVDCPACRATGWLSAQQLGIQDPEAQGALGRSERGWQP